MKPLAEWGFWDFYRAFRSAPFQWWPPRALWFAWKLCQFEDAVRNYRGPDAETTPDRHD